MVSMGSPLESIKSAGAERLAASITPSQIPHVQHGARIAAGIEHEQAQALNDALEAAGADERLEHDAEHRQRVLLDAADAISNQRFTTWWFETMLGPHMENAADAAQYAGLDADEWREQIRDWHAKAYERGLADDPPAEAAPATLGESAARVVRGRFDLTLREFVENVVTWDRGEAVRHVFAGPIDAHNRAIRRLAGEIRQREDRIEELESDE